MKMSTIFRVIFTVALLVGVYSETGIFTTIALGLMLVYREMVGYVLRRL